MVRILTRTVNRTVLSIARAVRSQQSPLDSLTQVVLDDRIALDYLLAAQGGVYAIVNTSYCTWINTSQQVEIGTTKLFKLAKSLKRHSSFTPAWFNFKFSDVFIWLIILIYALYVIFKLLMLHISHCYTTTQNVIAIVAHRLKTVHQIYSLTKRNENLIDIETLFSQTSLLKCKTLT